MLCINEIIVKDPTEVARMINSIARDDYYASAYKEC